MYAADQGRIEVCRLLLKGFLIYFLSTIIIIITTTTAIIIIITTTTAIIVIITIIMLMTLEGAEKWEVEEEDRAVRKSRLDRLLDQVDHDHDHDNDHGHDYDDCSTGRHLNDT